ncbi:MAG: D-glycero-alpha-D-manno-heptose-1,7-bisphosphate 7-phosphatase [Candidatus Kapaibacterium sp.]
MNKAVFFDRDGVVNRKLAGDYVKKIDEFEFIDGFTDVLRMVKDAGWLAILITNQQGIGKGIMTDDDLMLVHEYMQREIKDMTGFQFDEIYYCPHLEGSGSKFRKPAPGMLLEAIDKWDIPRASAWMLGDSPKDATAAKRAGIKSILIGEDIRKDMTDADYVFKNIRQAGDFLKDKLD